MKLKNPEILAPAGDFNSAIHALSNGADAVYLGLTSFSARKKAQNFTIDEVARLKNYAVQNSKAIYVAVNTLLKEGEIEELYPTLKELEYLEVNAVIVQDLGVAAIIKEFTTLTIHASTQLAVHNIHGAKAALDMGFSRVVLSRELTLNEIRKIKEALPQLELEVFIHGALCYGFSGLCLASSNMLGRSANRGECGQICRTWFNNNGKKEYSFSLNDLTLEEKVLKLKEIGVESLKIEGRLKGPGYAATISKLYYEILNGKEYKESLKNGKLEFTRSGTDAYLSTSKSTNKTNLQYPGHTGYEIGKIVRSDKNSFTVECREEINDRDGLMIFDKKELPEPIKFSASVIKKSRSSYILKGKLPKSFKPELYKVSRHDRHLKENKSSSYKPWKREIPLSIILSADNIEIRATDLTFKYPIEFEKAEKPQNLKEQFNKALFAGGESFFKYPVMEFLNRSDIKSPYIPASKIKNIRKLFQADFLNKIKSTELPPVKVDIESREYIRNRAELPFISDFDTLKIEELEVVDGKILLPLTPVIFDSESYLERLKYFMDKSIENEFIIGLNNISHLEFIKELPDTQEYFCDYGIYAVNNYTKKFLIGKVPNLKWVTKWIESSENSDYPPIFISRVCFKSQHGGCPENCHKSFTYHLDQNGKKQRVIVKECMTYTFID